MIKFIQYKLSNELCIIIVLFLIVILQFFHKYIYLNSKEDLALDPNIINSKVIEWIRTKKESPCEKWIISRSVREPTLELMMMNDAFYGWCLLVVADLNSPPIWTYKDVKYLSLDEQNLLSDQFELIRNIPLDSIKRKICGYLYAISKGAVFIFETDDNVFFPDGLNRFKYEKFKGIVLNNFTNGFIDPLESYFKAQNNDYLYYIYNDLNYSIPIIQQGLIMKSLQEYDINVPSLILNRNQYALIDSRSTLFHYDAFWSLMMPLETQESLEIRSLIFMRLLNEINKRVAFVPMRSKIHEYNEEKKYKLKNNLISALRDWTCINKELEKCFSSCIEFLVQKGFLNERESKFYNQWIKSLNLIGYKWPRLIKAGLNQSNLVKVFYKKIRTNKNRELHIQSLNKHCKIYSESIIHPIQITDVILVTFASNVTDMRDNIQLINTFFQYSIICYDGDLKDVEKSINLTVFNTVIIPIKIVNKVSKYKSCLSNAFDFGFKQQSFLIIGNKFKNFDFWNYDFSRLNFIPMLDSSDIFDLSLDLIYFYRRNVANSLKIIEIEKVALFSSLCDYLKVRKFDASDIFKGFSESISKLNFHSNDLASESCEEIKSRKIWIPDYHDGPRVDISSTLVHLGMKPILANPKNKNSPYPKALQLSKISNSLSYFIRNYLPFEQNVNLTAFRENFAYYQNLIEFKQVDAVICSFTVSLCEAYMSLNKTIIFNPAHR